MHLNINKYVFVFIGWLLRASHQLECLQCTGSLLRDSSNWKHSCLDGTTPPTACPKVANISDEYSHQCISAIFRSGSNGIAGVSITRHCFYGSFGKHDCDPPSIPIDFTKSDNFYCRFPCLDNGCNRHLVDEIKSNTSKLSIQNTYILLYYFYFLFVYNFRYYLLS